MFGFKKKVATPTPTKNYEIVRTTTKATLELVVLKIRTDDKSYLAYYPQQVISTTVLVDLTSGRISGGRDAPPGDFTKVLEFTRLSDDATGLIARATDLVTKAPQVTCGYVEPSEDGFTTFHDSKGNPFTLRNSTVREIAVHKITSTGKTVVLVDFELKKVELTNV